MCDAGTRLREPGMRGGDKERQLERERKPTSPSEAKEEVTSSR